MRITGVRIDLLSVPLLHPYHLSREYGVFQTATPVIVAISTDEGIIGYGECDPWPLFTGDSGEICALVLERHLSPMLIGCDPTDIESIHRIMDAYIRNQHVAKSAVDMACYDIWGKSLGKPVHELLGPKLRDSMKCMWSIGGSTPDESAEEVLKAKRLGYDGCMIKIGGNDWRLDAERTRAVREAVGRNYPLIVDANQGWDVETAVNYGRSIADLDILFFEQPVQSYDVKGLAEIRRRIDIPVSADEGVMTIQDAERLAEAKAADVFSIKVTKNGGIYRAKEIVDFAEAHGIKVFFNSMIEEGITEAASLHLAVTAKNIVTSIGHAFFSPNRLKSDICSYHEQIHPENGETVLSGLPGLGIELDEQAMKRYTVDTWQMTEAYSA